MLAGTSRITMTEWTAVQPIPDRDRQYSCAYFPKGTKTLEEAQGGSTEYFQSPTPALSAQSMVQLKKCPASLVPSLRTHLK